MIWFWGSHLLPLVWNVSIVSKATCRAIWFHLLNLYYGVCVLNIEKYFHHLAFLNVTIVAVGLRQCTMSKAYGNKGVGGEPDHRHKLPACRRGGSMRGTDLAEWLSRDKYLGVMSQVILSTTLHGRYDGLHFCHRTSWQSSKRIVHSSDSNPWADLCRKPTVRWVSKCCYSQAFEQ